LTVFVVSYFRGFVIDSISSVGYAASAQRDAQLAKIDRFQKATPESRTKTVVRRVGATHQCSYKPQSGGFHPPYGGLAGLAMNGVLNPERTWIDTAAVRFEQEWKKASRPRIEHFLAQVGESPRPLLLEELLRVDRELLQRRTAQPDVEEYRRWFPDSVAGSSNVIRPAGAP
jgi:hypothetical protein